MRVILETQERFSVRPPEMEVMGNAGRVLSKVSTEGGHAGDARVVLRKAIQGCRSWGTQGLVLSEALHGGRAYWERRLAIHSFN